MLHGQGLNENILLINMTGFEPSVHSTMIADCSIPLS